MWKLVLKLQGFMFQGCMNKEKAKWSKENIDLSGNIKIVLYFFTKIDSYMELP